MRRLGDLLAATYPDRVFVLSMPRSSGQSPRSLASVGGLERWLGAAPVTAAVDAVEDGPPSTTRRTAPGGVFVVAGPLSDDSLLRLIGSWAPVAGLESCTSPDRWGSLAAAGRNGRPPGGPRARALGDAVTSCPRPWARQGDTGGRHVPPPLHPGAREHLTRRFDQARPSSIIYARQSFCDPGAYDALIVARLAQERGLPYLEIEVDFPFDATGPLRTRVEAFLEAQLLDDDLLDDLFDDDDGVCWRPRRRSRRCGG